MLTRFANVVAPTTTPRASAPKPMTLRKLQSSRRVIARAEQPGSQGGAPTPQPNPQQPGTVFYGGVTYTEEQWKDAVARNEFAQAPPSTSQPSASELPPSVEEVMGFSGAPEIINGRLAMLGFVAALGAELSSGDTVLKQFAEEPTGIILTFILFSAASLVPAFARRTGDVLGPFKPEAEMLNGRAAMIGFASLLVLEGIRGVPLF